MKKAIKWILPMAVIGGLLFAGCKKKDETDPNNNTGNNPTPPMFDFGFVKVGNQSKFNLETGFGTLDSAAVLTINSDLGGGKYLAIFNVSTPFGSSTDTLLWFKNATGLWDYDSLGTAHIFLKANPVVGETYIGNFDWDEASGNIIDTTWRKVISVSESITVPVGTFTCAKVKEWSTASPADSTFIYVNASAGMVMQDMYGSTAAKATLVKKNF